MLRLLGDSIREAFYHEVEVEVLPRSLHMPWRLPICAAPTPFSVVHTAVNMPSTRLRADCMFHSDHLSMINGRLHVEQGDLAFPKPRTSTFGDIFLRFASSFNRLELELGLALRIKTELISLPPRLVLHNHWHPLLSPMFRPQVANEISVSE